MTASHLALWRHRRTLSARDLFCGADCTPAFAARHFRLSPVRVTWPPVASDWGQPARAATPTVRLPGGATRNMVVPDDEPVVLFALPVVGASTSTVDAVLDHMLDDGRRLLQVLVSRAAQLPSSLVPEEENLTGTAEGGPRAELQAALQTDVLAVHISLTPRREHPGLVDRSAADDWACVISPSGGRLAWGLSPVLSYILLQQD